MEPRIVCAAVIDCYDQIFIGARHFDELMRQAMESAICMKDEVEQQGFIDQYGKFYTRKEAYEIAKKNGQIIRRCGGDEGLLFSENLY